MNNLLQKIKFAFFISLNKVFNYTLVLAILEVANKGKATLRKYLAMVLLPSFANIYNDRSIDGRIYQWFCSF